MKQIAMFPDDEAGEEKYTKKIDAPVYEPRHPKPHLLQLMNSFICSTRRPFRFVGTMNEDVNTYTTLGSRGDLFFTFTSVQLDQKQTQEARQAGSRTSIVA